LLNAGCGGRAVAVMADPGGPCASVSLFLRERRIEPEPEWLPVQRTDVPMADRRLRGGRQKLWVSVNVFVASCLSLIASASVSRMHWTRVKPGHEQDQNIVPSAQEVIDLHLDFVLHHPGLQMPDDEREPAHGIRCLRVRLVLARVADEKWTALNPPRPRLRPQKRPIISPTKRRREASCAPSPRYGSSVAK
jgi:hypothetical protein